LLLHFQTSISFCKAIILPAQLHNGKYYAFNAYPWIYRINQYEKHADLLIWQHGITAAKTAG